MNHRERVLATLRHEEPDRVPIDLGGTCDSTIMAVSYQDLRQALGLPPGTTRVVDIYQQTAVIEEDVRQALGVDVVSIFGAPNAWRRGTLADGAPAELPAKFQPQVQPDGSRVVMDAQGHIVAKMPAGGPYFDPLYAPLADATSVREIEDHMDSIVNYDTPSHLDKSYAALAEDAKTLREETDYAVVGFFGGHLLQAGQVLRGWETFLMDLLVDKKFAHALLSKLLDAHLARLERYVATVGPYLDVLHFEEDLGMQDRPLMRPRVFREMLKPYMQRMFAFARLKCDAHILLHSDGAIAPFIPDLIEMGVDALNPVQISAAGMAPEVLKREFGQDMAFWGAGCDTQATLPFGTPRQVEQEVKCNIDILAPGGGFVFAAVHNIQAEVPTENTLAMFKTARQYGAYNR